MSLTPRQLAAYLEFSEQLDRIERADDLRVAAIASQGDGKLIEQVLKELTP